MLPFSIRKCIDQLLSNISDLSMCTYHIQFVLYNFIHLNILYFFILYLDKVMKIIDANGKINLVFELSKLKILQVLKLKPSLSF